MTLLSVVAGQQALHKTNWFNLIATTSTLANNGTPFILFNGFSVTPDTVNISTTQIPIVAEGYPVGVNTFIQYYYMQNIDMKITGYECKYNSGGGTGDGFFYGKYNFQVYWDDRGNNIYINDGPSGNSISSPFSTILSTTFLTNKLTGNPTVTIVGQVSTLSTGTFVTTTGANTARGYYTLSVTSTGTNPTNWMAEIKSSVIS